MNNRADWKEAAVSELFYVKGRIGWRGLKRSQFTDHGPYLITGMHIDDGKVQWDRCFHIPESKFLESPEIMVHEGDIVITKDGTIGKVGYIDWLPGPASLNSHLFLVRPKVEEIYQRFAYHVFTSSRFTNFVEQQRSGSTLSGLSEAKFLKFKLPVPKREEQKRIVRVLDTAAATIQQTEALIAKLKWVKAGLLRDLLTYGLDENGQLRDPVARPEQFKEIGGWRGRVPTSWVLLNVVDCISTIEQGWSPDCESEPAPIGEWGVLKTTSVIWDGYQESENKRLPVHLTPRPVYEVKTGDILMTRAGPNSRVGVVTYVEKTRNQLMFSDKIYRLVPKNLVMPHFLALTLSSEYTQKYLSTLKTGLAESQTNISQEIVRSLQVVIPPTEEQAQIINVIDCHDYRIRAEEAYRDKLHAIRQGLMHDLLTGKVRV